MSSITRECCICRAPIPQPRKAQVTCGASKCRDRHKSDLIRADPERYAKRLAQRAAHKREMYAARKDPWQFPPPPYAEFLPGRGLGLTIMGRIRFPIDLRNARLVHGLVTACIGKPHTRPAPGFSLVPWSGGLGVYVHGEDWRELAGETIGAAIADQPVQARFGPVWRMRSPRVRRGHQRVRIVAHTPVVIRNSGARWLTDATADHLIGTLRSSLAERLGAAVRTEDLRVEVLTSDVRVVSTDLGDKYGRIPGWQGTVDVECNAPARWLLECAARGWGLGGKTAFGFGRVSIVGAEG